MMVTQREGKRLARTLAVDVTQRPFSRYESSLQRSQDYYDNPIGKALYLRRSDGGRLVEAVLPDGETVLLRGRKAGLHLEVPPECGRMLYPAEDGRLARDPLAGGIGLSVSCVRHRRSSNARASSRAFPSCWDSGCRPTSSPR